MSVRIVEPRPLRTVGLGAAAGGGVLTFIAGFVGSAALVGVITIAVGVALLDAVDRGQVGWRQLGLLLLVTGGLIGPWALMVALLLAILGLPPDGAVLAFLGGSFLAVGTGMYILRYAPSLSQPAPARVRRRPVSVEARRLERVAG